MDRRLAFLALFASVLMGVSSAVAAPSTTGAVSINDSGSSLSNYEYLRVVSATNHWTLYFGSPLSTTNGAFGVWGAHGGWFNFTNAAMGSSATQTFALAGNASLTGIGTTDIYETTTSENSFFSPIPSSV